MTYKQELDPPLNLDVKLEAMQDQDLLNLGIHDLAYIRQVRVDDKVSYMIHAADGTPISSREDRASALATILGNDLEPTTLH